MIKLKIITNILQNLTFKSKITIKKIKHYHHPYLFPHHHQHRPHHRPLNYLFGSLVVSAIIALYPSSQFVSFSFPPFGYLSSSHVLSPRVSPQLALIVALFISFGMSIVVGVTIIPHLQLFQIMSYSLVCNSRPKIQHQINTW